MSRTNARTVAVDTARGAAIGVVEIIPGVSGGTVALVVGVYERVIDSAGHLVRAAVDLARPSGRARARDSWARVDWGLLLPLGIGMLAAVIVAAALVAPAIEQYPVQSRAVFAGLIAASLVVPIRMVGRWRAPQLALGALGVAAALLLTSLPTAVVDDPAWFSVVGAAAIAICALVLPGVSGSFILLVLGLYAPTLAAVNDRDLGYLGLFVLGAVLGLACFVSVLRWLLEHHRATTLAVMTGLMLGSLRALWPWQDEQGGLLAPDAATPGVVGLFLLAAAAVLGVLVLERRLSRRD